MSQGLTYNIDIVFVIDVTGSMQPVIDLVKSQVRKFPTDLLSDLKTNEKNVSQLRIRVIGFRDFGSDSEPLIASPFFIVEPSDDLASFESFVGGLVANGGGDEPESALEALSVALRSEWTTAGDRQRHVVVMFTDASAHKLEDRVGELPPQFSADVPNSLDGLTDHWDGDQTSTLSRAARRLIIFGPDAYPWNQISDNWGQTIWLPSQAGKGCSDVEYSTIITTVQKSI